MSVVTSTPRNGYDSWTGDGQPNKNHGSDSWLNLQNLNSRAWVWLPMPPDMTGRTIASATLTAHAHGTLVAQTLTVDLPTSRWAAGAITSNNQPATTSPSAALTITGANDGDELAWDVTALVQAMANGTQKNYGFRVWTDYATSAQKLAGFNSGVPSWTLTVEYDDAPEAPSVLVPDGTVVGAAKPVVSFDFTDYGGDSTDLGALRVEVDTNGDGTVDWDSGWLMATDPTLDLNAAGMTGTITAGQTVKWRAAVQDGAGLQSDFSDWATYTYRPLPTLTLDSPAAGLIYDPTSDVLAHISGGTLAAYRIQVTDGDDRTAVRYDSGKQKASDPANIAWTLPLRNTDNSRIFRDDQTYYVHVRAWDAYDRQATSGVPVYADVWSLVTFDDDLAMGAPSTLQARQTDVRPHVRLTGTDAAAPDAYLVTRDSVIIARLEPADVVSGVSSYSWVDNEPTPVDQHVYEVRRIVDGVGRSKPVRDAVTTRISGLWLIRSNGDYVRLDMMSGLQGAQFQTAERRLIYAPLNVPYEVDIVTAYEGISGPAELVVIDHSRQGGQAIDQSLAVLSAIKANPQESVRLSYLNTSKPVHVRDLSILPITDPPGLFNAWDQPHRVAFSVFQSGEFDWSVAGAAPGAGVVGIG